MAGAAHPLPHRYAARAAGGPSGDVAVTAAGLPALATQAPPEFGGPEGLWSPETLLAGAIADCYVLSFRAAARASRLEWLQLAVDVEALLEQADGVLRFTRVHILPRLSLPPTASETLALSVLDKAKRLCLVTNSLNAQCELAAQVDREPEAVTA
jgi:organic hydroperoxide reductase OsmC/OhrA